MFEVANKYIYGHSTTILGIYERNFPTFKSSLLIIYTVLTQSLVSDGTEISFQLAVNEKCAINTLLHMALVV